MPNLSGKLSLDGSQYNKTMSDAEKQNAHFARQVNSANKTLDTFQRQARTATSSISGLANSFKSGDIMGFVTGLRGAATALTSLVPAGASAATAFTSLGTAAMTALGPIGLITAAIAAIAGVGIASISAVEDFDASLRSLSALTGVTGKTLDNVGEGAIELSNKFGVAAKDIVGSMEKIGSQAPQLLGDMDALNKVTEAAIVLKKAAGNISMEEASAAVTTVMNQMGVSAEHATDIINTLAAGSQKGAADINYLNQAIAKSGSQAAAAGMGYNQLVGAIETIAPKFASAEVAGTALNTLLVRLQTQGESKFNPAVVGMEKALDNLAAANLTAEEKVKLFGQSALLAGNTLIESRKAYQDMTDAVTGTNTAYEQMETRSGGLATTWEKLKNTWNNFLIIIGQSAPIQAVIGALGLMMKAVGLLVNGLSGLVKIFNTVTSIIGALMQKLWTEGFKPWWDNIVQSITNSQIYKACAKIFKAIYDYVYKVISNIKKLWEQFMKWLGMQTGQDKVISVKTKVDNSEVEKLESSLSKANNKSTTTKAKIDYDKDSLEDYKKQLQSLEDRLSKKKLSFIDAEKTHQQIDALKKKIEDTEIKLKLKAAPNSLKGIQSEISDIEDQIASLDPNVKYDKILELQDELDKLNKKYDDTKARLQGATKIETKFKSEGDEGSIKYAEDKVSYYTQKIKLEVEGTDKFNEYSEKLKEWTKKKHEIELSIGADLSGIPEGTLEWFDKKISLIEAELKVTAQSTPRYDELTDELKRLKAEQQEVKIKYEADTSLANKGSLSDLQKRISDIKGKINLEVYGSKKYWELKNDLKELEKEEHVIKVKMDLDDMTALEKYDTFVGMFDGIDGVVNSFESLQNAIEENANAWEIFMSTVQLVDSVISAVQATMAAYQLVVELITGSKKAATVAEAANAAATLTSAGASVAAGAATTEEAGMEAAAVAPKTAETVANRALEASVLDLAAAQIFLAHAGIPFVGPGIAAGLITTMMAAMAAQHAASLALQAFESGGIVKGKSTIGDKNLVRVNSGEMILNSRQQNNLFKAIDQNRLGNNGSTNITGDVVVRGSKMHLLLKNYNKTKAGKDIGIR